jgi:hypothetical protein
LKELVNKHNNEIFSFMARQDKTPQIIGVAETIFRRYGHEVPTIKGLTSNTVLRDLNLDASMNTAVTELDEGLKKLKGDGGVEDFMKQLRWMFTQYKDIGEEIIDLFQQHYNLKASIARFYNVYGPYHLKEGGYCTVIGKWERAIETNSPIVIYGDGTKRRDFTHVNDIVNALLLIFQKNAWGYIFELGTGINYSIQEIADMFNYEYIVYDADKPGEAISTLCDSTLAANILNWKCNHNIKEYILNYMDSYE